MYVCMYVMSCMYVRMCVYVCMYVCMYVCLYVYIYIYIHIYERADLYVTPKTAKGFRTMRRLMRPAACKLKTSIYVMLRNCHRLCAETMRREVPKDQRVCTQQYEHLHHTDASLTCNE